MLSLSEPKTVAETRRQRLRGTISGQGLTGEVEPFHGEEDILVHLKGSSSQFYVVCKIWSLVIADELHGGGCLLNSAKSGQNSSELKTDEL